VIRTLLALALAAVVVATTVFFADQPGRASITWLGWRVDLPVSILVLALVLLVVLVRVVIWLLFTPVRLSRARRNEQRLQGYRVLTDGLVALAAGDASAADKARRRAELLFQRNRIELPPLARLLTAQAALLRGDTEAAKGEFEAMLASPETEFLGLRGLIVQALKSGADDAALALTERAKRLKPSAAWVLQSQLALETRAGDWRAATATLKEAVKRRAVTAEQGRHYKATLLVAHSRQAAADGKSSDALSYAAQAHGLEPGFVPAAAHYARLLQKGEKTAKALGVIEAAWQRDAHPLLGETYAELLGAETPSARLGRFEKLVEMRGTEPEGHIAAAAVAISARLWGEARRHLDRAGANGPGPWPRRLCLLMAEVEQGGRNDPAAAHLWLERAQNAAEPPLWVCGACGAETASWAPLCPSCQGFDTLAWRVPDRSAARALDPGHGAPADHGARMLALDA
jgi:HemY protein